MRIKKFAYVLAVVSTVHISYAHQENLDTLLDAYSSANALSKRTIDENRGHLVLYTREQLERMHARTLKDVFKTTPVVYYHENRYALPDPLASGSYEPYRSSFIRLFIDGVEVTQGWIGSGLVLFGDMNIDFVDHIEFYYLATSYETSVEPAYLTIYLYSKDPQRDPGGNLSLSYGSRGSHIESFYYAEKKADYDYMINISHTDANREKIENGTAYPLRRDFDRIQLVSSFRSGDHRMHLHLLRKNMDALAGVTYDATPTDSKIDLMNVHFDYEWSLSPHWQIHLIYEWLNSDLSQRDEFSTPLFPSLSGNFDITTQNSTYTADATYRNRIGKHALTTGIKTRFKRLGKATSKQTGTFHPAFDEEDIYTYFFQDQYTLAPHHLLSVGVSASEIRRNGGYDSDTLTQARLGYIYSLDKWHYKAYIYRQMFTLDPFIRYLSRSVYDVSIKPQTTYGFSQEVGYSDERYDLRLLAMWMQDRHGLMQLGGKGNTRYFNTIFFYTYRFDLDNRFDMQAYYADYKNIFTLDRLKDYSGYFSFSNRFGNIDLYNGLVWHRNTIDHKDYFDWDISLTWNISPDMSLTLKGENILNKAKKTALYRLDPSATSLATMPPLEISPIDRSVTIEWEYSF